MLTIKALSNGAGYAENHLGHNDYYSENERVVGKWLGRGAQMLGLSGEVSYPQFEAVREGYDPATGEFLRARHGADRIAPDGSAQSKARHLYDFTFSAPKSVSVLAQLAGPEGDPRLIEAHREAVRETLLELESHAAVRVRRNHANDNRTTGNLIVALYHHDTSRELDPQLHAHAVAANLSYDGVEQTWKALQASTIYERRAYLSEVYRNNLAHKILGLGYEIEERKDGKGFEISGVSDNLLNRYSQRSRQRDQAIQEFITQKGRSPSDNEIAGLVRDTRPDKLTEISSNEVRTHQRERLNPEDVRALAQLKRNGQDRTSPGPEISSNSASLSLAYAEEHVFERVSVAHDYELYSAALKHGRGRIDLAQLHGALRRQEENAEILRHKTQVTTQAGLERERRMVGIVNSGVGQFDPLGGRGPYVPADFMQAESREQQRHAVEFLLASRDLAVNLRGAAGTGKTDTLRELHRALDLGGRQVVAVAPSMTAVEELQKVGFHSAMTVDRFLLDSRAQQSSSPLVLIVDEAGMVGGRQMADLLAMAQRHSMRIVFSGDVKQIHSVEAADALRILERESELKSTSITWVHRQTNAAYREAVQQLRVNPAKGFAQLDEMHAIREVHYNDRAEATASAYFEAKDRLNSQGRPNSVLVVAPTHEQIADITARIRARRESQGELGSAMQTERYESLNFTMAQKKDVRNYRAGQVLVFHTKNKAAAKYESLDVLRVEGKIVIARDRGGHERRISSRQARAFDVFETRSMEVAVNDRLLLTANRRERHGIRITNGDLVTVAGFDERGRIQLDDGRILPGDYRQFAHGYAVTAHRSQGKTVDETVISGDGMERELFYVAATRGRQRVTILTSNKEALRTTIAASSERQSATELYSQATAGVPSDMRARSITLAKHVAYDRAQQEAQTAERAVRQQAREERLEVTPISPALLQQQGKEHLQYGLQQ